MGAYNGQKHASAPILYRLIVKLHFHAREAVVDAEYPWRNRDAKDPYTTVETWGPYASTASCNNQASKIRNLWKDSATTVETYNEFCVPEWKPSTR